MRAVSTRRPRAWLQKASRKQKPSLVHWTSMHFPTSETNKTTSHIRWFMIPFLNHVSDIDATSKSSKRTPLPTRLIICTCIVITTLPVTQTQKVLPYVWRSLAVATTSEKSCWRTSPAVIKQALAFGMRSEHRPHLCNCIPCDSSNSCQTHMFGANARRCLPTTTNNSN